MFSSRLKPRVVHRRGSVYLLVLAVATIVTVIGMSAIVASRLDVRASGRSLEAREAEILALAAVEQALTIIRDVPTWRDDFVHDDPAPPEIPMGSGFVSICMIDESGDENLGAGDDDPVRVHGIGRVGDAVRVHSVRLETGLSVPVLETAIHAEVAYVNHKYLTAYGGPVSTNGTLTAYWTLTADIEAAAVAGGGTITGSQDVPAPPKSMPPASVFDFYHNQATEIPFVAQDFAPEISGVVLGATTNPFGGINAHGVYHIAVPDGETLWIDAFRLDGTLLITAGAAASIHIDGDTHLDHYRSDYPVLIVRGASYTFEMGGSTSLLSIDSAYATGVTGLVHVIGSASTTQLGTDFNLTGVLISEGSVWREGGSGQAYVTRDPDIAANPPLGYASGLGEMNVVAGSWRWEAAQ